MKIDADNKQRTQSLFLFILEFYKVIMGTLLLLFIPQDCGNHSCSIIENMYSEGLFRNITKFYNIFTLVIVSSFYLVELRRENWCIEYLDIDNTKPLNNLDSEIEKYPIIKNNMNMRNSIYFKLTLASLISVIVNFVLSCIYIIPNNYGTNTFTSLISFGILVLVKLFSSYNIAQKSIKQELAYSAYMKMPITYNKIDTNYQIEDVSDSDEKTECDNLVSEENIKVNI